MVWWQFTFRFHLPWLHSITRSTTLNTLLLSLKNTFSKPNALAYFHERYSHNSLWLWGWKRSCKHILYDFFFFNSLNLKLLNAEQIYGETNVQNFWKKCSAPFGQKTLGRPTFCRQDVSSTWHWSCHLNARQVILNYSDQMSVGKMVFDQKAWHQRIIFFK